MNHLVGLEPCPCGAYRYLAARKLKRTIEVLLIHQERGSGVRKYRSVASVDWATLNLHDPRNQGSKKGATLVSVPLQTIGDLRRLVTVLERCTQSEKTT